MKRMQPAWRSESNADLDIMAQMATWAREDREHVHDALKAAMPALLAQAEQMAAEIRGG